VNIALANEFRAVAEGLGVDVEESIALANRHPRVDILHPGIGVGGHCLPIDPWFIHEVDPENSRLIELAREVNEGIPADIASKIRRAVAGIERPRIVCVGMTYKPDTYDLRNSPANEVVRLLREDGYEVTHVDPVVPGHGYDSLAAAARGADLLVVLVGHRAVLEELAHSEDDVRGGMRRAEVMRF
jgi:UDP-N-acetyl-D-mannosaminuronic acid dehydrogenase